MIYYLYYNKKGEAKESMKRGILQNKLYLYVTEFFAGMSVMAVELGASRLLAPYFSSSQIVWTIIIGTIMIAMALGNLYGGRSADQKPDPDILYRRILVAAIWIAAIPVIGKPVILGISAVIIFTINANYLIVAAFAACMVVFVFPLFLLGTVTPSLVKYTVDNLEDNGRLVGNLNACNTIGSIIGTFVPTFISIPAVGTSITFLIFAGILLALTCVYFISMKKRQKTVAVGILLFFLCCVFGHDASFAFWQHDLTYEGESVYNYLQVYENPEEVVLSTNVLFGVQSVYKKEKGLTGLYYDYAMAAPYMANCVKNGGGKVLILGMGTGTYATQCSRYFQGLTMKGVEIDEKITDLAHRYFALPEEVEVIGYDGRAFLQADKEKYDVIMVDAYQDITIPFSMSSKEFFSMVKKHLKKEGVMVVNMNMRDDSEGNINQYLADTIAHVFPEIYTVEVQNTTNRELFAGKNLLSKFSENLIGGMDPELSRRMRQVREDLKPYTGKTYCMTDDNAPVELLGMKVIDKLIRNEVEYYREIYKKGGIKALLVL